jgi:alpha-L-arabinofuranosidase
MYKKLFANNKGTHVVSILQDGNVLAGKDSLFASAVLDKTSGELIIKLVNTASAPVAYVVNLAGVKPSKKEGMMDVLTSNDSFAYNTLDQQKKIYPVQKTIAIKGNNINVSLPPMSLNVIKLSFR